MSSIQLPSVLVISLRWLDQMVFKDDIGFEQRMRAATEDVLQAFFPGCQVQYTREREDLRRFDDHFAIDTIITLRSGQIITAQQKCRRNQYLKYGDFTQEFMNAAGGIYETRGEWFHLATQLYLYCWANHAENGLAAWIRRVLLDVVKYKMLVEQAGGLDKIGTLGKTKSTAERVSTLYL